MSLLKPEAVLRSCTNRRRNADWRENFLPGKEKTRRNPDGFQAFLTQSRRKIFRLDVCRRLLVQLLSLNKNGVREINMAFIILGCALSGIYGPDGRLGEVGDKKAGKDLLGDEIRFLFCQDFIKSRMTQLQL